MENSKIPLVKIEFYEDENGSVYVHYWHSLSGIWERAIRWGDFISRKEVLKFMIKMYEIIHYRHPHHAERARLNIEKNLTKEEMYKFLRKFISYFMADDNESVYDFIYYTDGLGDITIENITCATNCPIIKQNIDYNLNMQANAKIENHMCNVVEYKRKLLKKILEG